jgi:hypothetical protein
MERHWQRGDVVILRDPLETRGTRVYETWARDTVQNVPGWPYVVIEDTDERTVLYLPEGTKIWRWDIREQPFREPRLTRGDSLRLLFPGKPFHADLFFETGSAAAPWVQFYFQRGEAPGHDGMPGLVERPSGSVNRQRFYGWKVDLITPFRRTPLGFDVSDEVLDIVVKPDHTYYWKDADQMAQCVEMGIYTQAEADKLFEAGREVIGLVEAAKSPFDDEWTTWAPTPDLQIPEAPEGWHLLPLADSEWGRIHREMLGRQQS